MQNAIRLKKQGFGMCWTTGWAIYVANIVHHSIELPSDSRNEGSERCGGHYMQGPTAFRSGANQSDGFSQGPADIACLLIGCHLHSVSRRHMRLMTRWAIYAAYNLADNACHVIRSLMTQDMTVSNAMDDVAGNTCQTVPFFMILSATGRLCTPCGSDWQLCLLAKSRATILT